MSHPGLPNLFGSMAAPEPKPLRALARRARKLVFAAPSDSDTDFHILDAKKVYFEIFVTLETGGHFAAGVAQWRPRVALAV